MREAFIEYGKFLANSWLYIYESFLALKYKQPKGYHPSSFYLIGVSVLEEFGNKQTLWHTHRLINIVLL